MSRLPDYSSQAQTYDSTRAASPALVSRLLAPLADAQGPTLADIGGGTGNYAAALREHGWEPLVVDRSPAMLRNAAGKGLDTLAADAEQLPLADAIFDAAMLVSMLHHVPAPARALGEAVRILRPRGRLAVMAFTAEDIADLWFLDYFPSSRWWMGETHLPRAQLLTLLPGAKASDFVLRDLADASLAVLASYPERVLDERWRSQTSYFERLQRDDHDGLQAGLRRLAHDIAARRAPTRPGRATVLSWTKPA